MIYLQIDEVVHNVYENATDGYGVIECASLTCLSSPCQSYATCVEFGDSWNCLCPSGYVYLILVHKCIVGVEVCDVDKLSKTT